MGCQTLRLVLGDQLSRGMSSLTDLDAALDVVLMAEAFDEATLVRYHRKKIAFQFAAMRHFAADLCDRGVDVDYLRLDQPDNSGCLRTEVVRAVARHRPRRVVVTCPGEYRLAHEVARWSETCGVPVEIREDTRFFWSRAEFAEWAGRRRHPRFAPFYQEARRRAGVLVSAGGLPEGGRWTHPLHPGGMAGGMGAPSAGPRREPDEITRAVLDLVARRFPHHVGDLESFQFATDQAGAERAFDHCRERLRAGAAAAGDPGDDPRANWALMALYLNSGLLDPRAVCGRLEADVRRGRAPLARAEAAIRLILGWREFHRGVYWLGMPAYADLNHLAAYGPLPAFYWSGQTEMACLRHAIDHAHHHAFTDPVSRLAVTGTFALLAAIAPREVAEWRRAIYADAFEWADLPHAHGAITFADGGLFNGQPRLSSGRHLSRRLPFCQRCGYDAGRAAGEGACPMNTLYWNFLMVNRERFAGNRRMAGRYRALDQLAPEMVADIRNDAERFLNSLA